MICFLFCLRSYYNPDVTSLLSNSENSQSDSLPCIWLRLLCIRFLVCRAVTTATAQQRQRLAESRRWHQRIIGNSCPRRGRVRLLCQAANVTEKLSRGTPLGSVAARTSYTWGTWNFSMFSASCPEWRRGWEGTCVSEPRRRSFRLKEETTSTWSSSSAFSVKRLWLRNRCQGDRNQMWQQQQQQQQLEVFTGKGGRKGAVSTVVVFYQWLLPSLFRSNTQQKCLGEIARKYLIMSKRRKNKTL